MNILMKLLSVIYLFIKLSESSEYIGTEESLRQNIKELNEGTLEFSDENLPFYKDEKEDTSPINGSEYDFIVIGAGSAGTTMASRLSEEKNITILLIEAGPKEYPIMDIPLLATSLQNSSINWNFTGEPSENFCLAMTNLQCKFPRGKVMGGSSVINTMLAVRGNKNDYNEWAEITGDESWSYKEILKYFKKLENFHANAVDVDEEFRNNNGPLNIITSTNRENISESFINAGRELGYPSGDYNGKDQTVFSYMQWTIYNGERWSANRAYLYPISNRSNLFITRYSHANKLLINNNTKVAYGVQFTKDGKIIEVKARKEIILSAGAIGSPQILMLSGIGPASHLQELNINVVKDAPVGENFMDHVGYPGLSFTTNQSAEDTPELLDPANPAIKDYINERSGPLTFSPLGNIAFINVTELSPSNESPNIEILFGPGSAIRGPICDSIGVRKEYCNKMYADKFENSSFTIFPMLLRPRSRGKLLLRSKDPNDKPKIFANYFNDPEDIRILIKGIRFSIELTKTTTFQKYSPKIYDVPLPNCQKYEYDSDAFWECASRFYTMSFNHLSGTCKMGRPEDPSSVLDSKLQVIGIQGLRVVDASFMPNIVSAHTHIPVVAASEKLADVIKKDWGYI